MCMEINGQNKTEVKFSSRSHPVQGIASDKNLVLWLLSNRSASLRSFTPFPVINNNKEENDDRSGDEDLAPWREVSSPARK